MIVLGDLLELRFVPSRREDADHWEVRLRLGKHRRLVGYATNLDGACRIALTRLSTEPERTALARARRGLEEAVQELIRRVRELPCAIGPDDPANGVRRSKETTSPEIGVPGQANEPPLGGQPIASGGQP